MLDELDQNPEITSEITHTLANVVSGIDSIPLPPVVKKSFLKALSTLITGVVDVPAAWLESKSQAIRDDTTGRSLFMTEAAKAAAKKSSSDEQLVQRSVEHFGARILKEQKNREAIAQAALKELGTTDPNQDTNQEIDEDWLDIFSRVAEQRSNHDMQLYLAKLLAGEIRKPGSFDPSTVEALAKLTPTMARTFQDFCNISMVVTSSVDELTVSLADDAPFVLVEPYGLPGQNALSDLGFSYSLITHLQDAGLVQYDLTAWKEFPIVIFDLPIEIGGTIMNFRTPDEFIQESFHKLTKVKVINFTTAGMQIRRIIDKTPNAEYVNKLKDWIDSTYGSQPT